MHPNKVMVAPLYLNYQSITYTYLAQCFPQEYNQTVWVGVVWAWSPVTSKQYSLVQVEENTKQGIVPFSINAHINVLAP